MKDEIISLLLLIFLMVVAAAGLLPLMEIFG